MLLLKKNLRMDMPKKKLSLKFVSLYRVLDAVGKQAYRLALLTTTRIYNVFYVSLLKNIMRMELTSRLQWLYYWMGSRNMKWTKYYSTDRLESGQSPIWSGGLGMDLISADGSGPGCNDYQRSLSSYPRGYIYTNVSFWQNCEYRT